MKPHDYPVVVEPLAAEDGGGWIGRVPDLPNCFSDGETPTEALANAYDAISSWLEIAGDKGWPVPIPSVSPFSVLADRPPPTLVNAA